MPVENPGFIEDLNPAWPLADDPGSEGDDHIRNLKATLQNQFPNLGPAAVTPDADELGSVTGASAANPLQAQIDALNTGASPLVGEIRAIAGTTIPVGWFDCDGSVKDQGTYPALFAQIGTLYNTGGEQPTEFRIPDTRGRSLMGKGSAIGGEWDGSDGIERVQGTYYGKNNEKLLADNIPRGQAITAGLEVETGVSSVNPAVAAYGRTDPVCIVTKIIYHGVLP